MEAKTPALGFSFRLPARPFSPVNNKVGHLEEQLTGLRNSCQAQQQRAVGSTSDFSASQKVGHAQWVIALKHHPLTVQKYPKPQT